MLENTAQYYRKEIQLRGKLDDEPSAGSRPMAVTWPPIPFTEQAPYFVRDLDGLEWAPTAVGSGELVRRASGKCGEITARIALRGPRATVPRDIRDKALQQVPADVRSRVPREYPWFRSLRIDDRNQLWVERDVDGGRRFDVYDSVSRLVAEVAVPRIFSGDLPFVIAHGRVIGFVKDADDVRSLVSWRIVR